MAGSERLRKCRRRAGRRQRSSSATKRVSASKLKTGTPSMSLTEGGMFRAPFEGMHGWFWRNRTSDSADNNGPGDRRLPGIRVGRAAFVQRGDR